MYRIKQLNKNKKTTKNKDKKNGKRLVAPQFIIAIKQ